MECLSQAIIALATLFAAYTAFTGVNIWKEKLRGETDFDVARNILQELYLYKRLFWNARTPLIRPHEFPADWSPRLPRSTEDSGWWLAHAKAFRHVYKNRHTPLFEQYQSLEKASVLGMAHWGPSVEELIDAFSNQLNRCVLAATEKLDDFDNSGRIFENDKERARKIESILHAPGPTESTDSLSNDFNDTFESFEKLCRSKMLVK